MDEQNRSIISAIINFFGQITAAVIGGAALIIAVPRYIVGVTCNT